MHVERIDHFVLTVADIEKSCAFYEKALGMVTVTFGQGRKALSFGGQKINLHQHGREFEPKAKAPHPGSGDFCLTTSLPMAEIIAHLQANRIPIEEGPVQRTGARAALISVYIRDPDGNLVEISTESAERV